MVSDSGKNNDERLNSVLDQILKLTKFDYEMRIPISEKGDKIDEVSKSLNTLAEMLKTKSSQDEIDKTRIESITDVLLEYAVLDFSRKIVLSDNADEIDAVSAGLNALGEELEFSFSSQKKYAKELEKLNSLLTESNKEISQKTEELNRSNVELEQFAYVASHDLQEPLRMITSYVQLLEKNYKDKLDQNAIDFINFAVDGATRMKTLIYSLLEYSRINRIKPFTNINLDDLLRDVMKDLSVSIKECNAKITWGALPIIFGDEVLIGQLFFNLIGNAIRFRRDQAPEIVINYKKQNNEYLFSVKDNGIGIKKEYNEKIFVIFQRLHAKDKYPGTGIGLAICKKIVERHGGTIWLESEIDKGSVFYFTIKADLKNPVENKELKEPKK